MLNLEVYSQQNDGNYKSFLFSTGISYQRTFTGEINLMYRGIEDSGMAGWATYGPRLGVEFNFNRDNFIFAPKIGYEVNLIIFATRLSLINYLSNGKSDIRLLPEIGITLFGWVDLTYGYSLSFSENSINSLANNRITLSINFDRKLYQKQ